MSDLIPISFFIGFLLATFGLVRVCEWLMHAAPAMRSDPGEGGGRREVTSAQTHQESAR